MKDLNIEDAVMVNLITHYVGNKYNEEQLIISTEETEFSEDTRNHLLKYFLSSFKAEEFYNFYHSVELNMNEVYSIAKSMFDGAGGFVINSQNLAKLLYESSVHPNLKGGEFNVVYFEDIELGNATTDAIGIFKSEHQSPFLKMNKEEAAFNINHEFGYDVKGIDKGCLIFNTNDYNGFNILVIDKKSKNSEAHYWMDDFLQIKTANDEYFQTKDFMTITKNFVVDQIGEEFEVDKTERIDLLNRSAEYFKTTDTFDKEEFEQHVFKQDDLIDSFRQYNQNYREEYQLDPVEQFEISAKAVKRQSRIFKSVLKLDKNFHVYIHGDKSLIERGVDEEGRKYYKIYYNQEH